MTSFSSSILAVSLSLFLCFYEFCGLLKCEIGAGANGRTGKEWKKLLPYVRSRLGADCNICESLASGPSHAIDIMREAIREGADAVIAVGGDGTLHEVVNGFFWAGKTAVHDYDRDAPIQLHLVSFLWGLDPILPEHLAGKMTPMKPLTI